MTHVEKVSAQSAPLTSLSSDELLFQEAVSAFAEAEVRPRMAEMEKTAHLDPALIRGAFELGLMEEDESAAGEEVHVVADEELDEP